MGERSSGGVGDAELLREYAEHGSEAAFAEIVRRYVDLVYTPVEVAEGA